MDVQIILEGPKISPNSYLKQNLGQFFFDSATKFKDRICQIDAKTDKSETFLSVKQRSVRVALEMQSRGITPNDVILTCSRVTLDTPIPIIAAFYLGVKVANSDPTLSVTQTAHMLSLVTPRMIFVEETSINIIEESLKHANLHSEIVVFGKSDKYPTLDHFDQPKEDEDKFHPLSVNIHDTGVMFFSSGTTGLPKAICHSHFSFLNLSSCFCESALKVDTTLSFTTFYWISGLMMLTCSFLKGGCRIVCSKVPEAKDVFGIIQKYKVTCLFLAPILTYPLTNFENSGNFDTSSLHSILTGGTAISEQQMRKLYTTFKHTCVLFAYGMTEIGMVGMFIPENDKAIMARKLTSCGKVAIGVSLKLVDIETNKTLGPNQKGEFRVKTPFMMNGYYKADCSDIFDEDGFLKTGDVGYYDTNGCLYIVERLKEMFKYLSWHIVPSVIENVLLEHPEIKEAAVFGMPINEEVGEAPAACVVLHNGSKVSEEEIGEFVASKLSDREKLRGGVFIVDELPRTPSGKLRRRDVKNYILSLNEKNK
ncbi:4-coumarate--CoA ligase 1-like [Tribolium madens]|uniref:4-coumarate--CoA ligase 1-like n=1 Tax=Tribolium madens TaxID=41895 RepID=UPI001CF753F6|nr:4-coumarate--CoA ligase 1-like [Tribolium madens]